MMKPPVPLRFPDDSPFPVTLLKLTIICSESDPQLTDRFHRYERKRLTQLGVRQWFIEADAEAAAASALFDLFFAVGVGAFYTWLLTNYPDQATKVDADLTKPVEHFLNIRAKTHRLHIRRQNGKWTQAEEVALDDLRSTDSCNEHILASCAGFLAGVRYYQPHNVDVIAGDLNDWARFGTSSSARQSVHAWHYLSAEELTEIPVFLRQRIASADHCVVPSAIATTAKDIKDHILANYGHWTDTVDRGLLHGLMTIPPDIVGLLTGCNEQLVGVAKTRLDRALRDAPIYPILKRVLKSA